MVLLWMVSVWWFASPRQEIKLETGGMFLDRIEMGTMVRQPDGSFLANNYHRVWHWAADGSLIARMGARGQGPGEFQSISQA